MLQLTHTSDDAPATRNTAAAHPIGRELTWRRLLGIAAVTDLVAILAIAAWLGDLEAAATAAGFGVGLALLRWRSGLAGRIVLAVLFADVLAWMALGAITNVTGGQPWTAVLIPAALTGISVTGLAAALASLRRRPRVGSGSLVAAALGVVVAVVALVAALVTPAEQTATAPDMRLVSEDVLFDRETITVPAGEVTVALENRDLFWHTFTVDGLGVDLAVPVNGDRQVTFTADPGSYVFYCRIPGHESRMVGTLVVR